MNKYTTPVLAILIASMAGLAAGQTSDIQPEPGVITADSPLYPVDKAFDSITKNQSEAAFERASEYATAETEEGRERAIQSLNNSIADAASSNQTQGLEKAESVLQQVKERTPDQANTGLDNAIENLGKAKKGELQPPEAQESRRGGDGINY